LHTTTKFSLVKNLYCRVKVIPYMLPDFREVNLMLEPKVGIKNPKKSKNCFN